MKIRILTLLLGTALCACGGGTARRAAQGSAPAEPERRTYAVVAVRPHPADAYTQGLFFRDGALWEGTGQYGSSRIFRTDLATGRAETLATLPDSEFGEGIAAVGDTLYQLTWQNNTVHLYDLRTLRPLGTKRYPGEGWGLCSDGRKLYMSDGTETLFEVDPATFRRGRRITVTAGGRPVPFLNELEWIDGRIWANVYTTDQIVVIDPASGRVERIVDLTGLLPEADRTPQTDVLNGIAHDPATGRIFVTGKNWNKLFEIEIQEP